MLTLLRRERFADLAPREVYATLLDEGVYRCAWSTMYRLLAECVNRFHHSQSLA